jgi:hypothetical protein
MSLIRIKLIVNPVQLVKHFGSLFSDDGVGGLPAVDGNLLNIISDEDGFESVDKKSEKKHQCK